MKTLRRFLITLSIMLAASLWSCVDNSVKDLYNILNSQDMKDLILEDSVYDDYGVSMSGNDIEVKFRFREGTSLDNLSSYEKELFKDLVIDSFASFVANRSSEDYLNELKSLEGSIILNFTDVEGAAISTNLPYSKIREYSSDLDIENFPASDAD